MRECLGMEKLEWEIMAKIVYSPEESERQIDAWSCGLFVMAAIQAFVDRSVHIPGNRAKETTRQMALEALQLVP